MQTGHLHRYKYLWKKCQDREVIIKAWKKLRKGKTKRRDVIRIESNFDFYVEKMQRMLAETRPGGNPELMFTPRYQKPKEIIEHGKVRQIYRPKIWEQWVHHIIVVVLNKIIVRTSYPYSCGSMPKRGGVYGKVKLEAVIRKGGFRHFAKLDIRHFFDNTEIRFVVKQLGLLIEDDWFMFLVCRCYIWIKKGMVLGFYLSQWLENYILAPLDWMIKRRRPKVYIRYVDDIVIGSDNKRFLHKLIIFIKRRLGKLHLKLKTNYQVIRFDYRGRGRGIDFMGFVFRRDRTIIRRSIYYRAVRFARRLKKLPVIAPGQAYSMIARNGWFWHTDTKQAWIDNIQKNVNINAMKDIIRVSQRKEEMRMKYLYPEFAIAA